MCTTDDAFKFRNKKAFNHTVDTIDASKSSLEHLDANTSTSESPSFATKLESVFKKSLDIVFNRQKGFAISSNDDTSFDQAMDDFDDTGEFYIRDPKNGEVALV